MTEQPTNGTIHFDDEDRSKFFRAEGEYTFYVPERSEWVCHLFGGRKGKGISYRPVKGYEPNWFVRWMMKVCFDCTWVKEKNT
jgi:hypothetical protein